MTLHRAPDADPLQDPMLVTEAATWPKTMGIVSILFAALGLTCNSCGVASPFLMSMVPEQPGFGPMPDVMKPAFSMVVLSGLGIVWSMLLLVAGIVTLRRERAGRMLHVVWAVGALITTIAGVAISVKVTQDQQAWKAANADSPWAKSMGSAGLSYAFIGASVLITGFWPAFCALWFGLLKKDPAAAAPSID